MTIWIAVYTELKKRVKVASRSFSTLRPLGSIVFLPQQVPAFISRDATHLTDARDLYQRRRELIPNFVSRSVIYKNLIGSFTWRKAGTWDILFYFPSEGRHTEDFLDALKILRLRPGLNPRTRVPDHRRRLYTELISWWWSASLLETRRSLLLK
jgi:hypothetical protein